MANPRFIAKPDPEPEHDGEWVIYDTQQERIQEHGYDSKEQAEANIAKHFSDFPAGL